MKKMKCPVCGKYVEYITVFGRQDTVSCFQDEDANGISKMYTTHWPVCCRTGGYDTEDEAIEAWENKILL